MTFSCRYFADGSQYGQFDFAKIMYDSLGDGYVSNVGNKLVCSCDGSDMRVQVATGRGYIHGYSFDVTDSPEYVTLPTADPTYDRIDRVVARLSPDVNQNIILTYVQGTPASTPAAPALARTEQTWEISLAQVRVPHGSSYIPSGNVTDERDDYSLCGVANIVRDKIPVARLPIATSSTVGVVKPGYGLRVESDGSLVAVVTGLTGYYAQEVPTNHVALQLNPGFNITCTTQDNTPSTSRGNYDVSLTFSGWTIPSVMTANVSFTIETIQHYTVWYSALSPTDKTIVNCTSATINVHKDGVLIKTIDGSGQKETKNIKISGYTLAEVLNSTWTIDGSFELYTKPSYVNDYYTSTHANASFGISKFVIEQ